MVKIRSLISSNDSDQDWETWGKENPYFGVYSDPQFLDSNLDEANRTAFFSSGQAHISRVYQVIRASIRPDFAPETVLDYGCGVGRLLLSLAGQAKAVTGVDVSPSMLAEAGRNCTAFGVSNVALVHVGEMGNLPAGGFDFIHCFIVFQHIPPDRGEAIVRQLLGLLKEGGVAALQFTFSDTRRGRAATVRRAVTWLRKRVTLAHGTINLLKGRRFGSPLMQMNLYSLDRLFALLVEAGCQNVHVEFSDHGGYLGAMLYIEKVRRPFL